MMQILLLKKNYLHFMKHLFPIIMWTAYSKFLSALNSYPTQTVQFPEISTNSVLLL